MKPPPSVPVKSADRAFDVLEYVAHAGAAPLAAQISAALGIPSSSLSYLLSNLTQRGYLKQSSPRGSYTLGPGLVSLAAAAARKPSWHGMAEPVVDQVWNALKETTSYFEPRGDVMECLIVKLARHSLIPVHRVGEQSPLHVFSGGKIVLAERGADFLNAYLERTKLTRLTPHTLCTPSAVRARIAEVRKDGIGTSREEHSLGIVGLSVGLFIGAELAGTLGVAIPAARSSAAIEHDIKQALRKGAAEFADRAG